MKVEWRSSPDPRFTWVEEGGVATVLTWQRPAFPLSLTWVGPEQISVSALDVDTGENSIAAIFGPPGKPGDTGAEGPRGEPGQPGYAIIPDVLDGGNF